MWRVPSPLTSANKRVGNEDLLRLATRGWGRRLSTAAAALSTTTTATSSTTTTDRCGWGSRLIGRGGLLAVRAGMTRRAWVALLVLEENRADVVDGNVDGVGNT